MYTLGSAPGMLRRVFAEIAMKVGRGFRAPTLPW
jgi:hypothetical protein